MLSTAIASGKANLLVTADAAQMADSLRMRILKHTPVRGIDPVARALETDRGRQPYRSLVLAVGADPLRLPLAGDAAPDVLSVNHIADYRALRRRLDDAGTRARVLILGAGLIGCELADDLLAGGHHVTLVDPSPRPLAALAAPSLSAALVAGWAGRELDLRMGDTALAVHPAMRGYAVDLCSGVTVQADLVISAVGLRPSTALACRSGLRTGAGILVDAFGRTSEPDIFALGDCAEYEVNGGRVVLPYVAPMLSASRALAATLSGTPMPLALKAEPVIVKTPSCRLGLYPPPRGASGEWRSETTGGRTIARFVDRDGIVRGFGMTVPTAALCRAMSSELGTAA
jgi:rubredoxin-NAD+ reductase